MRAVIPEHVHEPLPAVIVVEEGGIEARAVEKNRIRPWPLDGRRGGEPVAAVLRRPYPRLHVGIHEVEKTPAEAQARRPDAARIEVSSHVQEARPVQGTIQEAPMREVPGMVDADPGEPFEGGGGDIVVALHTKDRRVRIEAGKNRVADGAHAAARIRRGKKRVNVFLYLDFWPRKTKYVSSRGRNDARHSDCNEK